MLRKMLNCLFNPELGIFCLFTAGEFIDNNINMLLLRPENVNNDHYGLISSNKFSADTYFIVLRHT